MDVFPSSHQYIILDACCIINLYASGKMHLILECNPFRFAVTSYVKEKEVLYIYDNSMDDLYSVKIGINLNQFIETGSLVVVAPKNPDERQTYVNLAYKLDDGEAITGAIAIHRNWGIGTDDKKAINIISTNSPNLTVFSTLELIKYWVDKTNPSSEVVKRMFYDIRTKARYEPGIEHPLYKWWNLNS